MKRGGRGAGGRDRCPDRRAVSRLVLTTNAEFSGKSYHCYLLLSPPIFSHYCFYRLPHWPTSSTTTS